MPLHQCGIILHSISVLRSNERAPSINLILCLISPLIDLDYVHFMHKTQKKINVIFSLDFVSIRSGKSREMNANEKSVWELIDFGMS